ncbi:MAG: hypothetical protein QXG52_08855 [Candidatus Caldarchaeum sp.]
MTLVSVMEKILESIRQATNITPKPSWIGTSDTPPVVTVIHAGGGGEVLGLSDRALAVYDFQIDIWAKSALQRDQIFDEIVEKLIRNWQTQYQNHGWWSLSYTRVFDVEEEGLFRKTFIITVKEVI